MGKYIEYEVSSRILMVEEKVEINMGSDSIEKIIIEMSNYVIPNVEKKGVVIVRFYFEDSISFEDAKGISNKKIYEIVNQLAFIKSLEIYDIRLRNSNFDEVNIIENLMTVKFDIAVQFNTTELEELKKAIKDSNSGHIFYKLYKDAITFGDNMTKFMSLYSILFIILNVQYQSEIDSFIESNDPSESALKVPQTRNPSNFETRYTWLRNQVGHTQSNSDIEKVSQEMSQLVNKLAGFVRDAIKSRI